MAKRLHAVVSISTSTPQLAVFTSSKKRGEREQEGGKSEGQGQNFGLSTSGCSEIEIEVPTRVAPPHWFPFPTVQYGKFSVTVSDTQPAEIKTS